MSNKIQQRIVRLDMPLLSVLLCSSRGLRKEGNQHRKWHDESFQTVERCSHVGEAGWVQLGRSATKEHLEFVAKWSNGTGLQD
jgi:hypothetical protein